MSEEESSKESSEEEGEEVENEEEEGMDYPDKNLDSEQNTDNTKNPNTDQLSKDKRSEIGGIQDDLDDMAFNLCQSFPSFGLNNTANYSKFSYNKGDNNKYMFDSEHKGGRDENNKEDRKSTLSMINTDNGDNQLTNRSSKRPYNSKSSQYNSNNNIKMKKEFREIGMQVGDSQKYQEVNIIKDKEKNEDLVFGENMNTKNISKKSNEKDIGTYEGKFLRKGGNQISTDNGNMDFAKKNISELYKKKLGKVKEQQRQQQQAMEMEKNGTTSGQVIGRVMIRISSQADWIYRFCCI